MPRQTPYRATTVLDVTSKAPEPDLAEVLATVRELSAELHRGSMPSAPASASLERDFGLDSLARVELAERLARRLGRRLSEEAVSQVQTPQDLLTALRCAPRWHATAIDLASDSAASAKLLQPAAAEAELPDRIGNLSAAFAWHVQRHPMRTHLLVHGPQDAPQAVGYGPLHAQALALAKGLLQAHRVRRGDRVAIMLPTGAEFFIAFHGVLAAGAIPVPIYPPIRQAQLAEHLRRVAGILDNAQAQVLIAEPAAAMLVTLLRALAPALRHIASPVSLMDSGQLDEARPARPEDVALLQYTSGSTGAPKGVVLTHAQLMANLRGMRAACGAHSGDLFVSWLPLYHDMGLIGAALGAMVFGFPLALMSPTTFLARPSRWLWLIHAHRATLSAGPNFAFQLCVNRIDDAELQGLDLSSLRRLFNGAETVSPDTIAQFQARMSQYGLRDAAIAPVYGLAESALGLCFPPQDRGPRLDIIDRASLLTQGKAVPVAQSAAAIRLVSCGRVLANHDLRIARGDIVLGEREQGEIEFRGPSACAGYHRNPEADVLLHHQGWLRTGDLGYLADGELFVTGRSKDLIIRGGRNIAPQELEEAGSSLPGVRKGGVAVFAARDARLGTERLVAVLETRASTAQAREAIARDFGHLAVDLIGLPVDEVLLAAPRSLPRTSSGKLRRAECRLRYERGDRFDAPVGAGGAAPWRALLPLATEALRAALDRGFEALSAIGWAIRAWTSLALLAPLAWLQVRCARDPANARASARRWARRLLRLWGAQPEILGDTRVLGESACVLIANHASYLDGVVLSAALPPCIAFVAKRELAGQVFAGGLLRGLGAVFVERFDTRRSAADAGLIGAALRRGERVVVFAEGTLRAEPGLLPMHMGGFLAAAQQGLPVVPVAIIGTRAMLPDGSWRPRPGALKVVIGAALNASPVSVGNHRWAQALSLRARTRDWLSTQTGEPDIGLSGRKTPEASGL